MNILGITTVAFLVGALAYAVTMFIMTLVDPVDNLPWFIVAIALGIAVWIGGIFIGIGLTTNEAKVFVASYEVEKMTIEQSIDSDILTGFERIELVKLASELNGELAARKEKSTFWHWIYFEKGIYDNVEFIDLGGSVNESN